MNKFSILFSLFFLANSISYSQQVDKGNPISRKGDSTRSTRILVLPALGYSQETGFQYGLTNLISFKLDKDTLTRISNISAIAVLTVKKQSIFSLKPDIWSRGNKYHYTADLRYRDFPINFYGVGDKTRKADEERISQKLGRVGVQVEKLMRRGTYTGINLSYDNYRFSDKEPGGLYESNGFIRDKDGGEVIFTGLSQILDFRNSNTYTTSGTYIKLNYSVAPDLFGGENFSGSTTKLDFRTFKSFDLKTVLGFQVVYQTIQGSATPFYLLPQLGNDEIMRGYYTGRYRNRSLLATQFELKYKIIPQVGVVGFGGTGSVYNNGLNIENFKPSYGAGIRYIFDVAKGLSLRMDYAFGEKRADEKRQKGFYIAFGEAF
ncbi:MAG TPA: polymerase [Pedobacter sp.]|jgi:hypothetical protein